MYKNRFEAAEGLAEHVEKYRGHPGVVLAIPRGGVPIGFHLARKTRYPLELALIRKIGHPENSEFSIGAVNIHNKIVQRQIDVPGEYIKKESKRLRGQLLNEYEKLQGRNQHIDIAGKTVIITDDGVTTGSSMLATIQLARKESPKKIIVAIPVAPARSLRKFENLVDEIICLETPEEFSSVNDYYEDFSLVSDQEVMQLVRISHLDK